MKIFIKANPSSKEEKIIETEKDHYSVYVKEPPVKGKANEAIIKALSKHFKVRPSEVRIVSGYTSRQKIIEINGF